MAVQGTLARRRGRAGFTLLEVLVALGVFVAIMGIVGTTLVATVDGWDRGQRALDNMRRGDHVIDQLANALRSTSGGGASTKRGIYAFQLANIDGNPPTAELSWVTASPAFLPPNSPLAYGIHRIGLRIESLTDGRPALAVRAWPYLMTDQDEIAAIEPGFLAPNISGFQCRCYDYQVQDWSPEWTSSNALPAIVEITLYVNSGTDTTAEPLILQRLVEMPLDVTNVNQATAISLNLPASLQVGAGKGKNKGKGKGKDSKAGSGKGNQVGNQPTRNRGNMGPPPPAPPGPNQPPQPRRSRGNRGGGFGGG
ncbi:MAG: prepilin-type N-terminal cleavage/methylation domain-containing protein [Kiritimatiellaeota bacterium]|nr:prepilin-type N-terminal cleavage/methylation domain-containing protein [Kiritimatiellota bacterium]